jgi:hypothetical protein
VVPIWEQGKGRGIGYSLDSFLARFDDICREHVESRTVTLFAFIFYDLSDIGLKKVLKDHDVFTKLDRLAGDRLSIFYLHNPRERRQVQAFNDSFRKRLGVSESGPCIIFFRLDQDQLGEVQVCAIRSADAMHGFQELYEIVSTYLTDESAEVKTSNKWVVLRSGAQWFSKETISTLLKESLDKGKVLEHLSQFIRLHL